MAVLSSVSALVGFVSAIGLVVELVTKAVDSASAR
jgi:hypothetical protein